MTRKSPIEATTDRQIFGVRLAHPVASRGLEGMQNIGPAAGDGGQSAERVTGTLRVLFWGKNAENVLSL
jgi:hypothetical protein